jgi:hypothetical protein
VNRTDSSRRPSSAAAPSQLAPCKQGHRGGAEERQPERRRRPGPGRPGQERVLLPLPLLPGPRRAGRPRRRLLAVARRAPVRRPRRGRGGVGVAGPAARGRGRRRLLAVARRAPVRRPRHGRGGVGVAGPAARGRGRRRRGVVVELLHEGSVVCGGQRRGQKRAGRREEEEGESARCGRHGTMGEGERE